MNTCEKMPAKRILALGKQIFVSRPIRLAISMLLLIIVTVLYGVEFVAFCTNRFETELNLLYEKGWKIIGIEGHSYVFYPGGGNFIHYGGWRGDSDKIDEIIKEYNSGNEMRWYDYFDPSEEGREWPLDYLVDAVGFEEDNIFYYNWTLDGMPIGLTQINPDTGLDDLDLRPDDRFLNSELCRLPQTFDEIAITDLYASLFMRYGYKESDGTDVEVRTPDDLIGKQIGELTICGVYSTDMDRAYFEQYSDLTIDELYEKDRYNATIIDHARVYNRSIINFMFIKEGDRSDSKYLRLVHDGRYNMIKLSGDKNKDLKFFADLDGVSTSTVIIKSPFYGFFDPLYFFHDDYHVQVPYLIGSGVIALIAFFFIRNLFKKSFDSLDGLCPPGMQGKDRLFVCFTSLGMFVGISFIISLLAVIAICGILNAIFMIPLFAITFASVALMFAVCAGITALSTVFTVIGQVRRKQPEQPKSASGNNDNIG